MKMLKGVSVVLLCLGLTVCFAATNEFARFRPSPFTPALQTSIPLYQGEPPQSYSYKSLGPVKGEYKVLGSDTLSVAMNHALDDMINKAKAMNANAVIKTKVFGNFRQYFAEGEAVVFDVMPKE